MVVWGEAGAMRAGRMRLEGGRRGGGGGHQTPRRVVGKIEAAWQSGCYPAILVPSDILQTLPLRPCAS